MAKDTIIDEVSVLRFFETGPIEKVEVVFNIVREKMRQRLQGQSPNIDGSSESMAGSRKRGARINPEISAAELPEAI